MVRFTRLGGFHALVLDLHDIVILYDLRDVPEAGDDEFSVMWFDVVKFSLDMSESTAALLFLRDTACCQFFEDRKHFLSPHGAAFQKDLAHSQDLPVI